MPELPEVEVIRAGLAQAVHGATIAGVEVRDPRALKRHVALGSEVAADFEARMTGVTLDTPLRRGKFLWVPLQGRSDALLTHLGMSGQLLLRTLEQADDRHVRVRMWLDTIDHGTLRLDFADQRLFGSLALDELTDAGDGTQIPTQVTHIARDPVDVAFDSREVRAGLLRRRQGIKASLLDQRLISGIGNIYADEALWIARIHPETPSQNLSTRAVNRLIGAVQEVLAKALAEGGTSFDSLYVNVNGESGYFAHSLHAYGRTGEPCHRCGTPITRIAFANRGSHFCPRCQRRR